MVKWGWTGEGFEGQAEGFEFYLIGSTIGSWVKESQIIIGFEKAIPTSYIQKGRLGVRKQLLAWVKGMV